MEERENPTAVSASVVDMGHGHESNKVNGNVLPPEKNHQNQLSESSKLPTLPTILILAGVAAIPVFIGKCRAAVAWQVDVHSVSCLHQLIINWTLTLTTVGYPLLLLLVVLAIKDGMDEEQAQTYGGNGGLNNLTSYAFALPAFFLNIQHMLAVVKL